MIKLLYTNNKQIYTLFNNKLSEVVRWLTSYNKNLVFFLYCESIKKYSKYKYK